MNKNRTIAAAMLGCFLTGTLACGAVWAKEPNPNLALDRPVLVDSAFANDFSGDKAVDGNENTRWYIVPTDSDGHWARIYFPGSAFINRIEILQSVNTCTEFQVNGTFRARAKELQVETMTCQDAGEGKELVTIKTEDFYADNIRLNLLNAYEGNVYEIRVFYDCGEAMPEIPKMKLDADILGNELYAGAENMLDFDRSTAWETYLTNFDVVFDLKEEKLLNYFLICEEYPTITKFRLEYSTDGESWSPLLDESFLGCDREYYTQDVSARYLRFVVEDAKDMIRLNSFE
mgnify:CR=1 FL=1